MRIATTPALNEWLGDHRAELVSALEAAVRIPSISTDPGYEDDLRQSAIYCADLAKRSGFGNVEVWDSAGAPVVFAQRIEDPALPTVLVYAHHDVQPAGRLTDWETPPFEPVQVASGLRGRGVADDKQHIVMHAQAVEALLAVDGRLPINVSLILDGDEESGSAAFLQEFHRHRREIDADLLVASGRMLGPRLPSLNVGVRGLVYLEIEFEVMPRDLHSGLYGGTALNSIHALAAAVAGLHSSDGSIAIPGFYDRVRPPTDDERDVLSNCEFDAEAFLTMGGVRRPVGEPGWTLLERRTIRPSLDVCGIYGGYTDIGAKTIIPARCSAKLSARLVPDQDPHEIAELTRRYITALAPHDVAVNVTIVQEAPWLRTPIHHPAVEAALGVLHRTWKMRPRLTLEGGSIPPVASMIQELTVPCVLFGVLLPDANAHGPNEHLQLDQLHRGVEATAELWKRVGAIGKRQLRLARE